MYKELLNLWKPQLQPKANFDISLSELCHQPKLTREHCEIWGSHGSNSEDYCLLGCDTVQSDKSLKMFQRNPLSPFSITNMKAEGSSETLVMTYKTMQCHIPEVIFRVYYDQHLYDLKIDNSQSMLWI
jgi:hypothetical protein